MKKINIIKKNWEFQKIISLKRQYINRFLILYYKKNNDFQIGVSIPKKFAIAAKRNYIKRQIKHILDKNEYINKIRNHHFVLIVRKEFINLPFLQKEQQIKKILDKFEQN